VAFLKNIMPGCSMMFRKEVVSLIKDKDATLPLMHDHLIFILSSLYGNIVYTNKKLIKYRQHDAKNIGAFYDSKITGERILKELREKIDFFKNNNVLNKKFKTQIEKVERFCISFSGNNIISRGKFIGYYLFLRENKLLSRVYGVIDCIFSGLYMSLKNLIKGQNRVVMKRWLFVLWALVVCMFFIKIFVLGKVLGR